MTQELEVDIDRVAADEELGEAALEPRGGIVGKASLVDIVEKHPSRFFVGPFGWVLENAKPVRFYETKGRLGLFELD